MRVSRIKITTTRSSSYRRRAKRPPESVTDHRSVSAIAGTYRAIISLGTNTTRLLIVRDADSGLAQVVAEQVGTRLGEGLAGRGSLSADGTARTLAAVERYVGRAREYDAALVTIATSAMRRADDAPAFGARMRAATGVELRILDGALEAEASFRGATHGSAPPPGRLAVLDIGGGSTECATGLAGVPGDAHSVEIGSVRVSERFPALLGTSPGPAARAAAAAARLEIAAELAAFARFSPVAEVRCVAGTPFTLAAVATRTHVDSVNGLLFSRETLDATLERLLALDVEARRALPGMLAQRADIIVGGGLILSEALRLLGATHGRLEANDLLLGYLLIERERERP